MGETYVRCPVLFFAGTDTEVGKTYIASLAAAALHGMGIRVGVYKPVASGCHRGAEGLISEDAVALWNAAGRPGRIEDVCPQRFAAPLAPPEAAAAEGKRVDSELLHGGSRSWQADSEALIVEGAGGAMSPLADGMLNVDLMMRFEKVSPVIIVADRLGAIHHALATCAAATQRGCPPKGLILSGVDERTDPSVASNDRQIAKYSDVPLWGRVRFGARQLDPAIVAELAALARPGDRDDAAS